MEFIGYAYDVRALKEILAEVSDYCTVVILSAEPQLSTPEVYYDEARQEIIFK